MEKRSWFFFVVRCRFPKRGGGWVVTRRLQASEFADQIEVWQEVEERVSRKAGVVLGVRQASWPETLGGLQTLPHHIQEDVYGDLKAQTCETTKAAGRHARTVLGR